MYLNAATSALSQALATDIAEQLRPLRADLLGNHAAISSGRPRTAGDEINLRAQVTHAASRS